VKRSEDVIEILEAYDLLQSIEGAARTVGCDAKTVRRYVMDRDLGHDVAESVHRANPTRGATPARISCRHEMGQPRWNVLITLGNRRSGSLHGTPSNPRSPRFAPAREILQPLPV
jgi:hypothetical protein